MTGWIISMVVAFLGERVSRHFIQWEETLPPYHDVVNGDRFLASGATVKVILSLGASIGLFLTLAIPFGGGAPRDLVSWIIYLAAVIIFALIDIVLIRVFRGWPLTLLLFVVPFWLSALKYL